MPDLADPPALFFAPFVSSTMRVEPQWIDYNGHLNMAYYNVLLDRAVDEAFALVGLGRDYLAACAASYFTAESHIVYRRELKADEAVRATLQLIGHDDKRVHYYMELRHAQDGWISAVSESLALHVDMSSRKVAPFPDAIAAALRAMQTAHRALPRPETLGRTMRLSRPAADPAAPA